MRSQNITTGQQSPASQYNSLLQDSQAASYLMAHQLLGSFTLPNQPSDGDTVILTVNGTAITFTAKNAIGSTAGFVARGASASAFVTNFLAGLQRPDITTSTYVAVSAANITLLQYLDFFAVGTTIYVFSANSSVYAPQSSFSASVSTAGNAFTASTLKLFVQPGAYWINGTRYTYAGGSSPTFTAPAANPRIDVLTIDTSGTLAITQGAENASPSVPAYPSNKLPLCEIYNVTGETSIFDNNNQTVGQGYINNDIRTFMQAPFNPGALAIDLIPSANNGQNLGSGSFQWNVGYFNQVLQNGAPVAASRFGGTGADGALTITSGTTTINCANALIVTKNYTSISITGTATLAFSNPSTNGTFLFLRSQGAVTLTSSSAPMIDASGMGANNGTGGAIGSNVGTIGSTGMTTMAGIVNAGNFGTNLAPGAATASAGTLAWQQIQLYSRIIRMFTGGGGGGGAGANGTGTGAGGNGGLGGGALVIESAGTLNFTTASGISVAGKIGSAGTGASSGGTGGGGGGGGGGGSNLILYNSLTAASGTVTVSGGTGGAGANGGSGSAGGAGGAGGNGTSGSGIGAIGGSGGGGSNQAGYGGGGGGSDSGMSDGALGLNGTASVGSGGGGGGGGASGVSLVTSNVYFS